MRWWMWVATAVGVVAIVALAAAWVALTTALADLERQDDRLESLERQPGTPAVVGDRLDALEGRIGRLVDVQSQIADALDRIEALENQTPPTAPSLTPVLDRIAALEQQVAWVGETLDRMEQQVVQIETERSSALAPVLDRIAALEQQVGQVGAALERISALADQAAALTERIEALEGQETAGSAALAGALDRLDRLATLFAALERHVAQAAQSEAQFIVANTIQRGVHPTDMWVEYCIIYTVPGGVQERCNWGKYVQTGPTAWSLTPNTQWAADCFFPARIGEPLPDCWR